MSTTSTLAWSPASGTIELDPGSLVLNASGPVFVILWALVLSAIATWVVVVLKARQLNRWRTAETRFESALQNAGTANELLELCHRHPDAIGSPVLRALLWSRGQPELLVPVAERELTFQQQRVLSLLTVLSTIGSAAPFVGLLGTVYGIMDAFLRIGQERSATLPVVAPAIGEALIATAIGLFAAIPAVIAYNALSRRLHDLVDSVQASARVWAAQVMRLEPGEG